MSVIGDEHFDHLERHGYVVVHDFLSTSELEACRANIEEVLAQHPIRSEGAGHSDILGFPFVGDALNATVAHPEILSFVERAIGTTDVVLGDCQLWPKRGGGAEYDQPLHLDYDSNDLTYPKARGDQRQVSVMLLYTDVTEDLGPTYVVSDEHARDRPIYPPRRPRDLDPQLYTYEVPVIASAGSLLIWSMRTWHRGSRFRDPHGHRYVQFNIYRSATCRWMGRGAFVRESLTAEMAHFLEHTTPRGRELVGFPSVTDRYWDEETLAGVAARYPEMDMAPYRRS